MLHRLIFTLVPLALLLSTAAPAADPMPAPAPPIIGAKSYLVIDSRTGAAVIGLLDELAIFNRPLTGEELAQLHREPGLLAKATP